MKGFVLKTRGIRWIIFSLASVGVLIAGGAFYLSYLGAIIGGCKVVIRHSIPSPNGNKSLVIFSTECGATVPFNTQVSIAPARGTFSRESNPAFFVISGEYDVMARWLGDNAVEVANPMGARVVRSEQSAGDIKNISSKRSPDNGSN